MPKRNSSKRSRGGGNTSYDADKIELKDGYTVYIVNVNEAIDPKNFTIRTISTVNTDPRPLRNETNDTVTLQKEGDLDEITISVKSVVLAEQYEKYNNSITKKQQDRRTEETDAQRIKDEVNSKAETFLIETLQPVFSLSDIVNTGQYDLPQIVAKMIDKNKIGVSELFVDSNATLINKTNIKWSIANTSKELLNNIILPNSEGFFLTLEIRNPRSNDSKSYYFYVFKHDGNLHVVLLQYGVGRSHEYLTDKYESIKQLNDQNKIELLLAYENNPSLLNWINPREYDTLIDKFKNSESIDKLEPEGGKPKRSLRKRRKTKRRKSHRRRK